SFLVVDQDGRKWGKWIVRKAFENLLPAEITWRVKTPIVWLRDNDVASDL
ncbi:hypothetical protein E6H25_01535, partial [Candidatus Bathyarchaeota archaeon]